MTNCATLLVLWSMNILFVKVREWFGVEIYLLYGKCASCEIKIPLCIPFVPICHGPILSPMLIDSKFTAELRLILKMVIVATRMK